MGVKVAKDAIDLGIVTTNGDAMLTFTAMCSASSMKATSPCRTWASR
jgi:hypothetical protein